MYCETFENTEICTNYGEEPVSPRGVNARVSEQRHHPRIVYSPPVSQIDLSISHEDVKRFKDIHNNSRDENNAFLTENRPSLT